MAARIVVFGATGYTGRLVSEALVNRGAQPVLAGRSAPALAALATELGGLETAVADVGTPDTVRALVSRGDVLVSTVGPFVRWGSVAVEAAIDAGANYIDSTGEPQFIRDVFERYGPGAQSAGCALLTAFGYDWVPGNLAGALALNEVGDDAAKVEIGYFVTPGSLPSASGGTQASTAHAMLSPGFAWRGGRLVTERIGARVRSFEVDGRARYALSASSSEHFALPRVAPQLRDVDVYLGWFGPLSRPLQAASAVTSAITRIPGARGLLDGLVERTMKGSTGGPDAEQRAKSGSHIVAIARSADGAELTRVDVRGTDGYSFTGEIIAWGAIASAETGVNGTGALGPVDAFGLDVLEGGARSAGIEVYAPSASTQ